MSEIEHFDVVVVGAGFSSLGAAKAYVQIAPHTKLVVLDANKTLGGVWSQGKVYEGLRSNNLRGTLEYPDYPFPDALGVAHGEHIPAPAVHQYLCEYARRFDVTRRIRFESRAVEAEKLGGGEDGTAGGWRLSIESPAGRYDITTDKLIVGTGLTSQPQKMHIPGEEDYGGPFLHAGQLVTDAQGIIDDTSAEHVTVFGGSKYAWDSVYMFAAAGKKVDWVIRKTGYGPTWMTKTVTQIPLVGSTRTEHIVTTRLVTWMSPSIFPNVDGSGWWRSLLHGTWLGRKLVATLWSIIGRTLLGEAGFFDHPALKPLLPDSGFFDIATSLGILNYPIDILDFVRSGQVQVYREDVERLAQHTVHLSNGVSLRSDAFVASGGWHWKPSLHFTDTALHAEIGVPSQDYSDEQREVWARHDRAADEEIFHRLPMLQGRKGPTQSERTAPYETDMGLPYTPQRFYRCIAPPGLTARGDRSLAFTGFGANITHSIKAEITGVWIYAFLNGMLDVEPRDTYREAALTQRWSMHRHTYGFGRRYPDFVLEAIPYNDLLLRDLGMSGLRKGGSWVRECFEPYTVADYRGVTEEWVRRKMGRGKSE